MLLFVCLIATVGTAYWQAGSVGATMSDKADAFLATLSDEENQGKMDKLMRNLANATPMGKSGIAKDIAMGALYLASDEGAFVNCHDLVIDGGRTSNFFEKPR